MRRFLPILSLLAVVTAQAQLGPEIARRHAERAGDRLAALTAVRAEGRTFINGEFVPFLLVAQRPNRLRVESFTPLRRALQVYDGQTAPWTSHSETKGGSVQDMAKTDAADFIANADFDGPLVNFAAKGYSVDYAGEEVVEGRAAYKLLVMNQRDVIFFIWVDTQSAEIVKRTAYRMSNGQRVTMDTLFKDFREVAGVMQPHRIETMANGRLIHVTLIDRMEANVAIPAGTFVRPDARDIQKP
jgi:outer membrane lipoprotein-sorting protein